MASTFCEAAGGGDWTVSQAKQAFGGSATRLAAALAGVDSSQKAYGRDVKVQSQLQNLGRWQEAQNPHLGPYPEGKGPRSSRQISPAQQTKLNNTVRAELRRGKPLGHIRIKGKLTANGSDTQRREREINKRINWRMVDRLGAIACAPGKDSEARAWRAFSVWYNEGDDGLSLSPNGKVDIEIT
jgi:hypothetical protein